MENCPFYLLMSEICCTFVGSIMKKVFNILLLSCLALQLMGTEPAVQLWHGGEKVYEKAINKVDSITFPNRQVSFWRNGVASNFAMGEGDQLKYSYADFYDSFHQNPDYLYDIDSVAEIKITVTQADWETYLSNFDQWPHNSLYVPAAFEYKKNGRVFTRDSVGLRPRGNTSRVRPQGTDGNWHHAHFGIKFTEYATGERFFGSDRVILKWFKYDPTYVREIFCYDMMRRFGVWSASRVCYVRLTIQVIGQANPVYMGVYAMIENPRKGYLKARRDDGYIPDNDGNMWKAAYGATFSDPNASMGIDDDYGIENHTYALKLVKSNLEAAKTELKTYIPTLNQLPSGSQNLKNWLEQNMDVDLFIRTMAVDVMVANCDGYWLNMNNYFVYFDTNHKLYFIPFDLDNSLGTAIEQYGNPGTKDLLNWGPRDGTRILARKVFSIPEYETRFKNYIKQIATSDDLMSEAGSKARIRAWQAMISPYVSNDTGEDMTIYDAPASWGYYGGYRLLSGGIGDGQSGEEANFFKTKINSIPVDW